MDLRRLHSLVAVAEHGTFSAAARALHTVQSNVSTHVARLEAELDAVLVDRASGDLTEAGRTVANRARRIQAELDAMVDDVASLSDEVAGRVRLGVIGSTARWLGAHLLSECHRRHPGVDLVIHDGTTAALVPLLSAGTIDLAVVHLPIKDPEVIATPLFQEDTIVVAPLDHPLAQLDEVSMSHLAHHPLLLSTRGNALRDELDRRAAALDTVLQVQAELDGVRLIASLAFSGFGPAVLPASAAPGWIGGDWKRVPMTDGVRRSVGVATRRRARPTIASTAVVGVIEDVLATHGPPHGGIHLPVEPKRRERS